MTQQIQIQAIPNQSFSATLDERRYQLTIKEAGGVMSADVIRDNVTIAQGARIAAGTPLIPYLYQEQGNFIITTEGGRIPYYQQFGITQFLIYASPLELVAFRG